jgi:hypothetical protein
MAEKTNENKAATPVLNRTLKHEKSSLDFDRDKNLIYRPQDEGLEQEEEFAEENPVPEDQPYQNPLDDETHEIKTSDEATASLAEVKFDEEDKDKRDISTRPRETVNTLPRARH